MQALIRAAPAAPATAGRLALRFKIGQIGGYLSLKLLTKGWLQTFGCAELRHRPWLQHNVQAVKAAAIVGEHQRVAAGVSHKSVTAVPPFGNEGAVVLNSQHT